MQCPLCNDDQRAKLELEYYSGTSLEVISEQYEFILEDVKLHMKLHLYEETDSMEEFKQSDKYDFLLKKAFDLNKRIDRFFNTDDGQKQHTDQIVSMLNEFRQTMKVIIEIEESRKGDESEAFAELDRLRALLVNEVCEECKQKILKAL